MCSALPIARTTTSPELRPTRIRSSRPRVRRTSSVEGCIAGAQGVILVGNGGTEQGHDAVPQHLIHRALEAVYGGHHALQGRIEELLRGFGIEATDEFCGVLEVGKKHGDL